MALGYLGLQAEETASKNFEQILLLNRYHIGAYLMRHRL
jgi:hypothetical protein